MGSVVVEKRCSSSLQDAAFTSFGGTVAKDGLALGGYRIIAFSQSFSLLLPPMAY